MSYSQRYPQQYQGTSNENQQPCWNNVDFATVVPSENYCRFPEDPAYYDSSLLPVSEQNAPSLNYSQYLDFEASEVGCATGSNHVLSSQPLFNTSPASTVSPRQYTNFPIKTEPDFEQNEIPFSRGLNISQEKDASQRPCGPMPPCLHYLEFPEIEDFNQSESFPSRTISNPEQEPTRRPSHANSGLINSRRKPSDDDGRKPRGKRPRKTSYDDSEEALARAKQAHSIVERRYRDNLNGKIMQLHQTLSAISSPAGIVGGLSRSTSTSAEDASGGTGTRVRKSDVMTDAVNYVNQSEVSMRHMTDEINRLTERVRTLEKLVKCEDCVLLKTMLRRQVQAQQG